MPNFIFEKIDIPGGPGTNGFVYISVDGVDSSGLAVGNFGDTNGDSHGFTVAHNGPFTQYDPPNSSNNTDVLGVTSNGEIYGDYTDWSNVQHGFVENSGVTTTIDAPFAKATNILGATASGELFGMYEDGSDTLHGFIDNNGTFTTITDPAATTTSVNGVNASGVIVGSITDSQFVAHAFVDNGGTFTTLNPPGSYSSTAVGVTASGELVGTYQDSANDQYGFTYNNGAYTKISVAGSTDNVISYVSDSGEIVGYYVDAGGNVHGFIDQSGTITSVDVPGATETEIMGINAAGDIYGDYNDSLGQHGFVGIPGPLNISVTPTAALAVQGGPAIAVLSGAPDISDTSSTTLSSATIEIANASGNPVTGDELYINGQQSGTVDGGLVTVNWNDTTKTLSLTGTASLSDYQTLLGEITYQDSGTDTPTGSHPQHAITWTVSDGEFSSSNTSEIAIERPPVVTASQVTINPNATTVAASSLFSVSDPDGDAITAYAVKDAGNGYFVLNGVAQANNQEIDVTAAQLSELTYVTEGGNDTVQARVSDGTLWGSWQSFTVTGPTASAVETNGSTALMQVGNNYYLDPVGGGSGPELNIGGVAVVAGQLSGWTPIGVEQTAGGYEVAFKLAGTDDFAVWATNSSGTYLSNLIGLVPGTDPSLEAIETTFHQDLNGDGTIGPPTTVIEAAGSTSLVQVGNNYFLDPVAGGSGPELNIGGVAVVAGQLSGWTPIGVEQTAGGYEVAFKLAGTDDFAVWAANSSGTYLSNLIGLVPGNDPSLEAIETTFHQDLNGDGTIGPPTAVIEAAGSTSLVQVGNNYFLDPVAGGSGPELNIGGVAVVAGQLSGWTPIGVEQTAGGYEVAFKLAGTDDFAVWATNSSGTYLSNLIGLVPGTDPSLEAIETTFHQDLNGDGTIGPPTTVIEAAGSTSLVQVGNNYFLDPVAGGSGPELNIGGVAVVAGQLSGWTPIGVEQTAGGYEVAFKLAGTDDFAVWATNSSGTYLSNLIGLVPGTDPSLEAIETTFHQDLNGDGTIGPPTTVIEAAGSTSLVQVGNNYFLDPVAGGSGPELNIGGVAVVAGQLSGWTPIGVEQTAGGYEVAFKLAGTDDFAVWAANSSGTYLSNLIGLVPGNDPSLEAIETTFHQDLNGDGTTGIYVAPGTTLQITSPLPSAVGAATIGTGATLELGTADSASITFSSSTGMLKLDSLTAFTGVIDNFTGNGSLSGSDEIDLKGINFNSVHDSYSNGILTVTDGTNTTTLDFNGTYVLANFDFASDGSGGTIVYDPPVSAQPQSLGTATQIVNGNAAAFLDSARHDSFVFAPTSGHNAATGWNPAMDARQTSPAASWNVADFLSNTHDGTHGHAFTADYAHDAMPAQPITDAQFHAHLGGFHIV